jgi:transcriptional regulator
MYTPPAFALKDEALIREIVSQYSFATLVTQGETGFEAVHVPIIWQDRGLVGHVARANRFFNDGQQALAIFAGPHAYVSPTWYDSGPAVPTWNYLAVHISGTLHEESGGAVSGELTSLVGKYEQETEGYSYAALPADYREKMQKGIRAFRLEITRVEAKAKLSQNHSPERVRRVIERLETSPDQNARELARYMRRLHMPFS